MGLGGLGDGLPWDNTESGTKLIPDRGREQVKAAELCLDVSSGLKVLKCRVLQII